MPWALDGLAFGVQKYTFLLSAVDAGGHHPKQPLPRLRGHATSPCRPRLQNFKCPQDFWVSCCPLSLAPDWTGVKRLGNGPETRERERNYVVPAAGERHERPTTQRQNPTSTLVRLVCSRSGRAAGTRGTSASAPAARVAGGLRLVVSQVAHVNVRDAELVHL